MLGFGLVHRSDRVLHVEGRLGPRRWAEIRADGPGEVHARLKRRGDRVRVNEPIAQLALEGEDAAVTAAEGDLAVAQRQLEAVAAQLDRMNEHAVVVPPPSVLDLGAWLEQQLRSRTAAGGLVAGATARMQAIRDELLARAGRIRDREERADGGRAKPVTLSPDRALASRLAPHEAQIRDAVRVAVGKGPHGSLDRALARYEDAIFEALCDLAHVPPPVVRDAFAARGPVATAAELAPSPAAGAASTSEGYFALQSELRRTQLDIRQLEVESANLARLHRVFPALAGERHGERKAISQALETLAARSQEARRQREDSLGDDDERLRNEVHRIGESLVDGVEQAWAQIDEGSVSGLADLEHQVSQLRLGFGALERAIERQRAAFASYGQGLIGRNALDEQSVTAEQQAHLFVDAVERLRISAEELFGKRVGEVELALGQKQSALEVVRAHLRKAMAATHDADEPQPLETARARHASAVARAEWALKAAKLALEAKVVRSPVDGVITSIGLQERATLARNEVVGLIEDLDGLVFKTMVPEGELAGLAVGQRVRLSIDVDNHRQAVAGHVSWIGRGGVVVEKEQRPWNLLVEVEGSTDSLMPALVGRADLVVGRPTGIERLRDLLRPSPTAVHRYLDPELPDPTRVLPVRPEPTPSGPAEPRPAIQVRNDALAPSTVSLVDPRGHR